MSPDTTTGIILVHLAAMCENDQLAVGLSSTLAIFLLETHEIR